MVFFNFAAIDQFKLDDLNTVETFVDNYPDFQTVALTDEDEFITLLELIGIHQVDCQELKSPVFSTYWDLSKFNFPEFNRHEFDEFYKNWLQKTNRDSNMDEFGMLIFLEGLSPEWNRRRYRIVVKDK